jgi:tetratricopeptide (TPR) repeat protein
MFSGPHIITGQNQLQVRLASEPSPAASVRMASQPGVMSLAQQVVELGPYETPSIKRSGLGVFGWLLLAALLFGGVGALLYVALGERGDRPPSKLDEAGQPAPRVGGGGSDVQAPEPARPGGGNIKVVPDDGSGEGPVQTAPEDPDHRTDPKKPNPRVPIKRPTPSPPAVSDNDPKALLKLGKQQEKGGDWEAARATYQKLEKIKGFIGIALYQQAWVALQKNEIDLAIQLAIRSAAQPGTHKTDAKFLYGDALYKQGEFRRAKDIYIGLRKTLTGDLKATATRKIAAANRALRLPEDDGITDD